MICVVDYGAGNLHSVHKALQHLGADAVVSSDADDIERAQKVVFPGVGAFGRAVSSINRLGLADVLRDVIDRGRPFLGICLGLQLLFESSEEKPGARGLAALDGQVRRFSEKLKVPHLGWNIVRPTAASPLWRGIPDDGYYYFAHSYYIAPQRPEIVVGESEYPAAFPAAIQRGSLFGLQFHPEKSQKLGLAVLRNFIELKNENYSRD